MSITGKKTSSKLFTPLKLGDITLKHRIILAPLTRVRCFEHVPGDMVTEYYSQRASDGGLLISEATHTSVMSGNITDAPGIYTPEQRRAWKKVTDVVHAKGGYIFCQLWHVGRKSHPLLLGGRQPLSSSPTLLEGGTVYFTRNPIGKPAVTPKEMTKQDLEETIEDYVHAAKTAIEAGFDGVEVHGANGYLLDQFHCDNINKRTDAYGGSPENRSRFTWEVVDAVAAAIGPRRTGVRFSPFSSLQGTAASDPIEQWSCLLNGLDNKGLAYVHLVKEQIDIGPEDPMKLRVYAAARKRGVPEEQFPEQLSFKIFKKLLRDTPMIVCGGFDGKNFHEPLKSGAMDAVAYGKLFISNPDIVERLRNGWELSPWDAETFYSETEEGYTSYPIYGEQQKVSNI